MTPESDQRTAIVVCATNADAIAGALHDTTYPILIVQTVTEIEQQLVEHAVALVIVDDLTCCEMLRPLTTAPIMMISEDIDAALNAGADDCLPYHPRLIAKRVTQYTRDVQHPFADRRKINTILNALPNTVLVIRQDNTISFTASKGTHPLLVGDLYGKTIHDILPSQVADTLSALVKKTLYTARTQETHYTLSPDQESRAYHAIGSPVNSEEVVVILRDITSQYQAENQVMISERIYRQLFENASDAIFVIDVRSGQILQASPQASYLLGYSQNELLDMTIEQIETDEINIPDSSSSANSTNKLTVESQYRRFDGSLIDVEISSRVMMHNKQLIVISFVRDISDSKRTLAEMMRQRNFAEALLGTANALNESPDLDTVLDKILTTVSRIIPCDSANIMIIEEDQAYVTRQIGYGQFGLRKAEVEAIRLPLEEARNLHWITVNKRPLYVPDTHHSKEFKWVNSPTADYVNSVLTAPIITNGEVIGFINLDSTAINHFSPEQTAQLMAFANQAAIAMQQASLIEKLHDYTDKLERRVSERTQELLLTNNELKTAQGQLAQERNLLRLIIDTIPDAIYVKDAQHRFVMANKATVENISIADNEADLIGKTDRDLYPDADRMIAEEQLIISRQRQRVDHSRIYNDHEGGSRHLLVTKVPLINEDGTVRGLIGINHEITELRQAQARLEQVVRSARCLLWSATVTQDAGTQKLNWEYQIVNENAAMDFLPLKQTEDMSYTEAWIASIPAEQQARRDAIFHEHSTDNSPDYHLEYDLHGVDQVYWLREDVMIEAIDDDQWYVVGVCTDITTRKQAETRLQQLNEELELRVISRTLELSRINNKLMAQIEERKRAEEAERQQRVIAEALRDGVAKLTTTLDRHEIFDHLLNTLKTIITHDASNIMLIEGDEVVIVHASSYPEPIINTRYLIKNMQDVQKIIAERIPSIINDVTEFNSWQEEDPWVRSNLSVPIIIDDEVVGLINLDSQHPHNFSVEQTQWLMTFGEQVGLAIRNARYAAELEQLVKERTQELEQEQAQLRTILNGVSNGVIYTNMHRVPQYVNRALEAITGYNETEWIDGTAQREMNVDSEEMLRDEWGRILRWLENNPIWTGEASFTRKDGTHFDASITRTTVRDQQGNPLGVVTVLRDISDEKHLQAQKARFITTAAHELRTPIANLKTRLFLIKRRPEKLEEHLAVAESVVNWMQNLVEHMFDVSRFQRGIIEIAHEAVPLQDFLQEILQYQIPQAERMDITITLDMPQEPLVIDADPYRLTQVISNLLSNALKYTAAQSEIVIRVERVPPDVLIDVIDSGPGIPDEHLPHVFQPFYQVSNDHKGAGLGLAIVQEIVKAHGGDVSVESTVGVGTTFHIQLPMSKSELESI
ncbi:MAG: PAS domain S-box protein [Anaerolineae bacterium]